MEQGGSGGIAWRLVWLLPTLAGCAAGLPLREDVAVSGTRFIAVQGEASVVVRSFFLDAAGRPVEVSGAVCAVTTSLYDAKLTTPARLRVPNFGPQSPELFVSCAAEGRTGSARQGINTFWQGTTTFYGALPYGPGFYGPGWGLMEPGYPISDYPDVDVILR